MNEDLESCIINGLSTLLVEPLESSIPINEGTYVKLYGKKVEFNSNFKLYILHKNPNYSSNVNMQLNYINFSVTQEGLED